MADRIDGLCAANHEAWRLHQQIVTRFTMDAQAVGMVLLRLTAGFSRDTFAELLERFTILYDALHPPTERPTED